MLLKDVINNLDEEGFSLLHLNAKSGNADNVQKLIEDGADIEIKDKKNGSTPLLWAHKCCEDTFGKRCQC